MAYTESTYCYVRVWLLERRVVLEPSYVVADRDLVTGRSACDLELYCDTQIAT